MTLYSFHDNSHVKRVKLLFYNKLKTIIFVDSRTINKCQTLSNKSLLYQSINANSQPQILICAESEDYQVEFVNEALKQKLKGMGVFPDNSFVGKNYLEVAAHSMSVNDINELRKSFEECISTKKSNRFSSVTDPNWESISYPLLDDQGNVQYILRTFQETYYEQNKIRQSLFEDAHASIFITDKKGNISDVNQASSVLTGYSKEELLTMNLADLVDPEELLEKPSEIKNLDNNKVINIKRTSIHKNGRRGVISTSMSSLPNGLVLAFARDITAEYEQNLALEHSEKALQSVMESIPSCVKLVDKNLVLKDINKSGLDYVEASSKEEIIGRNVLGLIEPAYKKAFQETYDAAYKGKSGRLVFELTGLKGTKRWMETRAVSFKDARTGEHFILGVTQDITEQKRKNDLNIEVNERFQTVTNATNDAIWDWDAKADKTWANKRLLKLYGSGQDPDKINRETFFERVHPDDKKRIYDVFHKSLETKKDKLLSEYRFRTGNGEYRHFLDRALIKYDADGKPLRILGAMQDITEIKRNEEKLKKSDKKHRYLFHNNPLPMFIYMVEDLRITDCNQASLEKYGYTREEFLKLTIKDIRPPSEVDKIVAEFDKKIEAGDKDNRVWTHCKKNGELMQMDITVHIITHEGEKSALVLANDITESQKNSEELKKTNHRLKTSNQIAHLGYWEYDFETNKIVWTEELYDILRIGAGRTEVELEEVMAVVNPDDAIIIQKQYTEALQNLGRTYHTGFRITWPNGEVRNIISVSKALKDPQTNKMIAEGTFQDVTERLRQLKAIEKQNEQFGKIAWLQSHKVRAPLARIMGLTALLKHDNLKDQKELIDFIHKSSEELDEIIKEVVRHTEQVSIKEMNK